MELDTGAAISVINELAYNTILAQQPPLQKSNVKLLHTYSGEQLVVLESCKSLYITMNRQLPYH